MTCAPKTVCVNCGVIGCASLRDPCPVCGAAYGLIPFRAAGSFPAVKAG